jgi:hypothetical protein
MNENLLQALMKNRRDEMRQIWCGADGLPAPATGGGSAAHQSPVFGGGHQFDSPFGNFGADSQHGLLRTASPSSSSHHHHLQHHQHPQQSQLQHLQQQQQQQQQHHQMMMAAPSPSFSLTPLHIGSRRDDDVMEEDDEEEDDIVGESRDSESPISDIEIAT